MKARTRNRIDSVGAYIFFTAIVFTIIVLSAWSFMLIVGVMHHDWWSVIPTISMKTSMLLTAIATFFSVLSRKIVKFFLGE